MFRINKILLLILFFTLLLTTGIFPQAALAAGNLGKTSDSSFYDSNTLYVVGEVINSGNTAVQNVNVRVVFSDSSNQVIRAITGFTDLNVILPGRKSFFNIQMLESEGSLNVNSYTIWFNWTDTSVGKPLGLVILSSNESTDAQGHKHVTGQVQNQGAVNSNNTEVSATFYNSTNAVVGTSWVFCSPANLAPNQIGNFDLELIYPQQVVKVASWSLTAESNALAFSPTPLTPTPTPSVSPNPTLSPTSNPSPTTSPMASTSSSPFPTATSSSSTNPMPSPTGADSSPLPTSSGTASPLPTENSGNTASADFTMTLIGLIAATVIIVVVALFIFLRIRKKKTMQE